MTVSHITRFSVQHSSLLSRSTVAEETRVEPVFPSIRFTRSDKEGSLRINKFTSDRESRNTFVKMKENAVRLSDVFPICFTSFVSLTQSRATVFVYPPRSYFYPPPRFFLALQNFSRRMTLLPSIAAESRAGPSSLPHLLPFLSFRFSYATRKHLVTSVVFFRFRRSWRL